MHSKYKHQSRSFQLLTKKFSDNHFQLITENRQEKRIFERNSVNWLALVHVKSIGVNFYVAALLSDTLNWWNAIQMSIHTSLGYTQKRTSFTAIRIAILWKRSCQLCWKLWNFYCKLIINVNFITSFITEKLNPGVLQSLDPIFPSKLFQCFSD